MMRSWPGSRRLPHRLLSRWATYRDAPAAVGHFRCLRCAGTALDFSGAATATRHPASGSLPAAGRLLVSVLAWRCGRCRHAEGAIQAGLRRSRSVAPSASRVTRFALRTRYSYRGYGFEGNHMPQKLLTIYRASGPPVTASTAPGGFVFDQPVKNQVLKAVFRVDFYDRPADGSDGKPLVVVPCDPGPAS